MIDIERQKENFKDHIATFTDYGNIKILDFKKPNSSHYRIRFMFEEDYFRLHISGDLGELIATNYCNMCWDKFYQFVDDVGYFEGKIDCCDRPIYVWDEDKAKEEINNYLKEYGYEQDVIDSSIYLHDDEEDIVLEFIEDVMEDFDDRRGIGSKGYETLEEVCPDVWEYGVSDFGKERSGILELYMLAFKLAKEQLDGEN